MQVSGSIFGDHFSNTRNTLAWDGSPNRAESSITSLPIPIEPRYERGLPIAKGGMGEVIEARELPVGRRVAMKVIHEAQRRNAAVRARFIEEAQITGQLEHPSIVPMHDLSIDDRGNVFYTMKRVEGETLGSILARLKKGDTATLQAFPLSRLLTIFQKICDAIAFAHSRGVIHRDLKPENVMVGTFGEVLVMDWGLAKVLNLPDLQITIQNQLAEDDDEVFPRTLDGTVMGTIGYMPPEQAEANKEMIGFPSDIYALGAVLYQILTLQKTVQAKSLDEGLSQTISGDFPAPTKLKEAKARHCPGNRVPQSLSAVAMRALSQKPEDRYHTVEALQQEIEAYQSGFATAAEEAGFWKNLRLFIGRHKIESFAAILIGLIVTGSSVFLFKAWRDADEQRKVADEQREVADQQRQVAVEQRKLAEDNAAVAKERSAELGRQVMRDWVQKGDQSAEDRHPNRALLRYAEAFRVGRENAVLSEAEEAVHRFRLGQFLGIAPRHESYGGVVVNSGFWVDEAGRAICGDKNHLLIRRQDDWQEIRRINLPHESFLVRIIKPALGGRVVVSTGEPLPTLFMVKVGESAGEDVITELRHDSKVINFAVNHNHVLTIEESGFLNRWNVKDSTVIDRIRVSDSRIHYGFVEVSPTSSHCGLRLWTEKQSVARLCPLLPTLGPLTELGSDGWGGANLGAPNTISFSNDGELVAFGYNHFKPGCVFRVADGSPITQATPRSRDDVYLNPITHQLANVFGGEVWIENFQEGKFGPAEVIDSEFDLNVRVFRVNKDGSRFAFSSHSEQTVRFCDFPSRRLLPCVVNFMELPDAKFLPDHDRFLVRGWPLRIPSRGAGPKVLCETNAERTVQFSADGNEVFVRSHYSKDMENAFVKITNPGKSRSIPNFALGMDLHKGTCDLDSGRWWFTSDKSWFVQNEKGGFDSILLKERHWSAAIQPFGRLLVTRNQSDLHKSQIWRFPEGKIVREVAGFVSPALKALPAPNNRYILFADKINSGGEVTLRLYDLETDRMTDLPNQLWQGHYMDTMRRASFSADSRLLMARNELFSIDEGIPRHAGVLDLDGGRVLAQGASSVAPRGDFCATVDTESSVHVYALPDRTQKGSPLVHPKEVNTLTFSPDSRWLATGCQDGKVRLWDVNSGTLVSYPLDTGERRKLIEFIQFNPAGTHLLARIENGGAYLWEFSPPVTAGADAVVNAAQIFSREQVTSQGSVMQIPLADWGRLIRDAPQEARKLYLTEELYQREFGGKSGDSQ